MECGLSFNNAAHGLWNLGKEVPFMQPEERARLVIDSYNIFTTCDGVN